MFWLGATWVLLGGPGGAGVEPRAPTCKACAPRLWASPQTARQSYVLSSLEESVCVSVLLLSHCRYRVSVLHRTLRYHNAQHFLIYIEISSGIRFVPCNYLEFLWIFLFKFFGIFMFEGHSHLFSGLTHSWLYTQGSLLPCCGEPLGCWWVTLGDCLQVNTLPTVLSHSQVSLILWCFIVHIN